METKYQIGDILTSGHYHYLIEDVSDYSPVCYEMRCLEDNRIMYSYVLVVDNDIKIRRAA